MDFVVAIDSREQAAYRFACGCVVKALGAGDYSVVGHESAVAVERKSLEDFISTVIHQRPRFLRELEKLTHYQAACVVVEACLDELLRGQLRPRCRGVAPESLLGMAQFISIHYGVPVFWCGSRQAARVFTETWLRTYVALAAKKGCLGNENHTL